MKNNRLYLVASLFIILYFGIVLSEKEDIKNIEIMIKSAEKMNNLSKEILKYKIENGISIDSSIDINKTGLLGEEYTEITTTLGNLESKRTSSNPDFAALFIKLFLENGITKGDKIAVNMSGSFPALNLSLISALDTLDLEGIIISSVGASTYGANNPSFTYLDMEKRLADKNYIKNKSVGYSLGGDGDIGNNFEEVTKAEILRRIDEYGLKKFYNSKLSDNLSERFNYYTQDREIKLFVNIGGNLLSEGLKLEFEKVGIPVISMLNIKAIASSYGIPIDPIPIPKIGVSNLYKEEKSNKLEYVILFVFIFYIIWNYFFVSDCKKKCDRK
ncbi:poly-gamma-glutamate system protein [Cetobacterium sp. 2A]|uniref:poly-gamma-glutamate system protein n=1 Tax=Cetobacterium sp. 2A TaxID=2754723 RepID=UPI00163CAFDB|nr:poly-gamma-glutamate system protein [Cetobacterium sp. 2A]MBC2855032.1 poly-gamma-glutamate system protein [Cetobacterium sp. 2A]